jgi:hypothetical protein
MPKKGGLHRVRVRSQWVIEYPNAHSQEPTGRFWNNKDLPSCRLEGVVENTPVHTRKSSYSSIGWAVSMWSGLDDS